MPSNPQMRVGAPRFIDLRGTWRARGRSFSALSILIFRRVRRHWAQTLVNLRDPNKSIITRVNNTNKNAETHHSTIKTKQKTSPTALIDFADDVWSLLTMIHGSFGVDQPRNLRLEREWEEIESDRWELAEQRTHSRRWTNSFRRSLVSRRVH